MKAIKICPENKAAIESALLQVNGRSTAHTYTSYQEISDIYVTAEHKLETICIPKKDRAGATWFETSGDSVPNAYARKCTTRNATQVCLVRKSNAWFLTDVKQDVIYQDGGGKGRLTITKAQAEIAHANFSKQFNVSGV